LLHQPIGFIANNGGKHSPIPKVDGPNTLRDANRLKLLDVVAIAP
jgi:hypothetical protein